MKHPFVTKGDLPGQGVADGDRSAGPISSCPRKAPILLYSWFSDNGHDRYTENRDDQGGWAPKEQITEALRELGLLPAVVVVGGK
jgi:hypothetical protein